FNVSKEDGVNAAAKKEGVEIRLHSIIYDLVDEIRASMTGLLAPQLKETIIGRATVLEVFAISKLGNVAGCMITAGRVSSRSKARVSRKGGIIYDGALSSLRRFQNDAGEAKEGQECGIRLDNFSAFEKDDTLEFYEVTKIAQAL
ncbi:MAG: translation initiation factor IF-2, partial [bacterium]